MDFVFEKAADGASILPIFPKAAFAALLTLPMLAFVIEFIFAYAIYDGSSSAQSVPFKIVRISL